MADNALVQQLEAVRDGSSFKARIFAFARLPQEVMQAVIDKPGTIAEGAAALLSDFQQG